jgi:hypothetical protein
MLQQYCSEKIVFKGCLKELAVFGKLQECVATVNLSTGWH